MTSAMTVEMEVMKHYVVRGQPFYLWDFEQFNTTYYLKDLLYFTTNTRGFSSLILK